MARKIEEFQKGFAEVEKAILACHEAIKNNERFIGQTSGVIDEGINEVGLQVQKLKDKGQSGTTIADFDKDADVKKMLASIEQYVQAIGKELKRVADLHAAAKSKHVKAFWALKKDLEAEIKSRKKEVSTKLNLGNKSLPDMEKLLDRMGKYVDSAVFVGVDAFVPETLDEHRRRVTQGLKQTVAQTKAAKLTAEQQMLDEQALNERNLAKNLGIVKTLAQTIAKASQEAAKAVAAKDAKALQTAKTEIAAAAKQVASIALIFERAFKDDWIKSKIRDSNAKGKIESTAKFITEANAKLKVMAAKVQALKV